LGKKWFGVFLTIEPGQTKDLNFNYFLPENIGKSLDDGSYKLLVQKQLGAAAYGLTLNLVSGKTMNTDLSIDRTFEFKNYAD